MDVILRPWQEEDIETLVEIANNANIAKYMADVFPYPYTFENGKSFMLSRLMIYLLEV
jgi:[ribosomal protein S5]-alanine N-acetyltransferase